MRIVHLIFTRFEHLDGKALRILAIIGRYRLAIYYFGLVVLLLSTGLLWLLE